MNFDDSFFDEEVKWGHTVTTKIKKVWAAELNILEEFDRICRKHGLQYFAGFGTLLGVVRHHGFIPWDDDIDLAMFRPDYERFKAVVASELKEPFEFQDEWCPFQTRSFCKIRDARTTGIEFIDAPNDYNQGLFIDIFPLDDACVSAEERSAEWEMEREMWSAISNPDAMQMTLSKPNHLLMPQDILQFMVNERGPQSMALFNGFCASHFGKTGKIHLLFRDFERPGRGLPINYYDKTIYLPFEGFEMPCPAGYEALLSDQFGNYMTPVKNASLHTGIVLDADRPYIEVLEELRNSQN